MNRIVLAFLLGAGCIKGATEDQTETPPPTPATNEAVYAAQPEPKQDDTVLASLGDVEKAYYADCSHKFQVEDDESDAMVDECLYVPFDQNCSPDPSGCWEKGQACVSTCAQGCKTCDDACGGSCDGCKGKCAKDDEACLIACVASRVECHDTCLATKETCSDTDCPEAETKCEDSHVALVAKRCKKCDEIKACFGKAIDDSVDNPFDFCGKKFKREPKECIEWCGEW